ncbi:MAG: hypothetical protein EOO88_62700 [Pedobacter sp.]|nr:MAG: hypothetical protein EOO88_62700 [Pedobacter sp.]
MEKLTLEYLAPYLPYKLVLGLTNSHAPIICTGLTIHEDGIMAHHKKGSVNVSLEKWYKPILRPMSDLLKVISHNGKKICLVEWLEDFYCTLDLHEQAIRLTNDIRWVNQCDYMLIVHLIEHHFDVFGLIEKGLAISIHDVKEVQNG